MLLSLRCLNVPQPQVHLLSWVCVTLVRTYYIIVDTCLPSSSPSFALMFLFVVVSPMVRTEPCTASQALELEKKMHRLDMSAEVRLISRLASLPPAHASASEGKLGLNVRIYLMLRDAPRYEVVIPDPRFEVDCNLQHFEPLGRKIALAGVAIPGPRPTPGIPSRDFGFLLDAGGAICRELLFRARCVHAQGGGIFESA